MNYKEKYEKALERARKLHSEPTGGTERIVCEQIFPELAESEDERIRNEIVEFVCWATDRGSITSEQREKSNTWIAWLKKQGLQKPTADDKELKKIEQEPAWSEEDEILHNQKE